MHADGRIRRDGDEELVCLGFAIGGELRFGRELGSGELEFGEVLKVLARDGDLDCGAELRAHRHRGEQARRGKDDLLREGADGECEPREARPKATYPGRAGRWPARLGGPPNPLVTLTFQATPARLKME